MHNSNGNLKSYDPTQRPIHLRHGRGSVVRIRCQTNRHATDERITLYPALVTCENCRAQFTKDEQRDARTDHTEPEGV